MGTFQKKAMTFEGIELEAFKFCHIMPYTMQLNVTNQWSFRKIFSMCKTEYAVGGAKLHHPPKIGLRYIEMIDTFPCMVNW